MEGPPPGPGGEDITWPDQVAPRGRKASSTRKIKPQTSNLLSLQDQDRQEERILASGPDAQRSGATGLHHPSGSVFKWEVMPFGVANAPALFQELMNKILSILQRRPKVQELISRGVQMEAHNDDVCLGTNTQEDHLILLDQFFAVCQENHTGLKLEKCEFMQETIQYPGLDVGYGWWNPAASKAKPLMDAKVRHEDPKKGLQDLRSFIRACNIYRRHIKNFTYTSAILTDLIKKITTWRWGPQEQQAFDELKDKVANAKCLGVPRAQGERLSW